MRFRVSPNAGAKVETSGVIPMMKLSTCLLTLLVLPIACVPLFAQTATSSLRGTVTDPAGALVVDATVTLTSGETGFHLVHKTGNDGSYQFQQVPPATYTLTITSPGFSTEEAVLQLLVSQPATMNIVLQVVASNTTVEVDPGAGAIINTTTASVGNSADEKTVEALPMEGRNVPDLLSLQPGVLYLGHENGQDTDSRSGAVAGARADQGNINLDGLDNNS